MTLRLLAVLVAGLFLAGPASALSDDIPLGSIGLTLEIDGEQVWGPVIEGQQDPEDPDVYNWTDGNASGSGYGITWESVEGDIDPGVSGSWTITNTATTTQIFTLSVVLPVLPVAPSSLMFGSSTLSVSDADFSGSATLASVSPFPVYSGLIDLAAVPAASLFTDPYSLVAGPGATVGDTESFGVFPGSVPGPAVTTSIGIQHVFSLTPGDRATLNSTFFLVAVPEPGTLVLAISGLVGLGLVGRRNARG